MEIVSWNVNWIRAVVQKWFLDFVKKENPDILCLQEVKAFENQIPSELRFFMNDYDYIWHQWKRAGYAWTAIFFKKSLSVLECKSDFDGVEHFHSDGRVTELRFVSWNEQKKISLLNLYFPNGGTRADWQEMLSYKKEFYDHFLHYIKNLEKQWFLVITCWDFNVCHKEIDIARPKENQNSIGFLPEERAKVDEVVNSGFVDVFRYFYPDKKDQYSWWSYRAWARQNNVGRRIDYFVVSDSLTVDLKDIEYLDNVIWSDHCPLSMEISL